ncbi:MAG: hypothetical protein GWN01_08675 [Nitrosopumilaceae archaeon]|nr:hypothetical protein [Nitrosopumilaceae archaeon]NIU87432.1 hypothetical protein [Nitrosopumilaceae archaeon]NIX61590.1 hypothetical protein [Nitrosopumilaceae archaeon]
MKLFKQKVRPVTEIVGSFTAELRKRKEEQEAITRAKAQEMDTETEEYRAKMEALQSVQKEAINETIAATAAIKGFENMFNQTQQSEE